MPATFLTAELRGLQIAYDLAGAGRTVLFIHGYPLSRALWRPQLSGLAGSARVLAPDLRGHGQSTAAPSPYSMELLADDLFALLDVLRIAEPVVLCGLSMGGYVALSFFRKYRERVAGLILAATRAGADSPEGKTNRDKSAVTAREAGVGSIAAAMLPKMLAPAAYDRNPELVAYVQKMMAGAPLAGILGDLTGMRDRPDSTPLLPEIKIPTLILHGLADALIPSKEAEAMHAEIAGSVLTLIPDAGHLPNLEQPELFNQAVQAFLTSL